MKCYLVLSLVLVYVIDHNCVYGTVGDFMKKLPTEIGKAFVDAWRSMKAAIKTPYRIKRMGRGGPLKTTAKPKVRHTSPHHTVRINAKKQLVKKYLVKIRIPEGPIITSNAFTKALIPLQTEPTSMASDNMKFVFKEHYDSKFEEHSVNQHEEDFDNRFEEYNYNR